MRIGLDREQAFSRIALTARLRSDAAKMRMHIRKKNVSNPVLDKIQNGKSQRPAHMTPEAGHSPAYFFARRRRGNEAHPTPRIRSMRRIGPPFNHPGLFQECVSEVPDRYGQHFRLLFLGGEENKIDEAFGHVRG
jgi:hypothetical protein